MQPFNVLPLIENLIKDVNDNTSRKLCSLVNRRIFDLTSTSTFNLKRDISSEIFLTKLTDFSFSPSLWAILPNPTNIWHRFSFVGCTKLWFFCGLARDSLPRSFYSLCHDKILFSCGFCLSTHVSLFNVICFAIRTFLIGNFPKSLVGIKPSKASSILATNYQQFPNKNIRLASAREILRCYEW